MILDEKIDTSRVERKIIVQLLDIGVQTLENWMAQGAPCEKEGTKNKIYFDIAKLIKWRTEKYDVKKLEKVLKKEKVADADIDNDSAPDSLLKQKITIQDLRKKTRENDEADGLLVNKKEMDKLFFDLGKNLRQNLMSKPAVYGPQCDGKNGFEITTYLLKEFERLCNSIGGLEGFKFDDEALAYEYHEMFIKGFEYGKQGQGV